MWVRFYNYLCLVALMVKNLPAMQETQVQSLGPKDPLEKEMATYSSILAWGIAWTEEPDRLQFIGLQRVGHDRATVETVSDCIFRGSKITADGDCSHEIKRCLLPESYDQPGQHIKKQKHHFANKGPSSQGYGFSSVHVWM